MSFAEHLAGDRRRAVLRILQEASGAANEKTALTLLRAVGFPATTRTDVRADFKHLEETGCATLEWFGDTLVIATMTERGANVLAGRETVKGVRKPSHLE